MNSDDFIVVIKFYSKLSGEGESLWLKFDHLGRTKWRTLPFFKSSHPAPTPCGKMDLTLKLKVAKQEKP